MKRYCIFTFVSSGILFPYSKCRYFLVQKAKDAETIGIVVGTLGVGKLNANNRNYTNSNNGDFVASYLNIIDHLKRIIRASGRKSYLFVMGKLNVAKMANFMEIDCYVLVSCPENSLIDSKVSSKGKQMNYLLMLMIRSFIVLLSHRLN